MSRPNRVRMLLVLAFALTLAAGVVAGIGFTRATPPGETAKPNSNPSTQPSPPARNWMADQLGLNPQQRDQLDTIWREAPHEKVRELEDARWKLRPEREKAIAALNTPEQKAERERIGKTYDSKMVELRKERDEAYAVLYTPEQKAKRDELTKAYEAKSAELVKKKEELLRPMVAKTVAMLNEEQKKKFEGMMARNGPERGGPERNGHRGGRPGTGPSTRPGGDRPPGSPPGYRPWNDGGGPRGERGGDRPPPPPPPQ